MKKIYLLWLEKLLKKEKSNLIVSLAEFQKSKNFETKLKYYTKAVMADTRIKTIEKIITVLENIPVVELERTGIKNERALLQYRNMLRMKINSQNRGIQ